MAFDDLSARSVPLWRRLLERLGVMRSQNALASEVQSGRFGGRGGRRGAMVLIMVVFSALAIFTTWASIAKIDQLARAQGQVIAKARTQVIQAADNGVLEQLRVSEGERVARDQVLAVMDQSRAQAAYEDSRNKVAALEATLARLVAEVYGRNIEFHEGLAPYPAFRENQQALFERRKQALVEGIQALEESAALIRSELIITEPLLASGDIGKVEVLRLQRQLAEVKGEIINTRNKFFQDAQAEMTRAEEDLAAQRQLLRERETVLGQTEIRAPVDGVVNRIEVNTLGASVRPGEVLMELLPTESELIVEAKYPPADVASLRLGLPTSVKLDAYDSSIYGSLDGEIIYISPDVIMENDPRMGETYYYRVRIRIQDPGASANKRTREIVITPGMTAMVEARTLERTVMSYLTKPITKTLSASLTER